MLAVKHVSDHPETPGMVLLSAHGGGRDGAQRTSRAGMLAGDRLDEITAQARALVAAGRGRELMLVPGWWYVISAESFLDRMTEMPDVLELAPTIYCPTLFIRGDEENPETYPAERAGGPCDVEIVSNCNHFYVGREATICKVVSGWLVRTLNIGARESH
jgi:pimeloyl-ACP methyl ester carboxylesterase